MNSDMAKNLFGLNRMELGVASTHKSETET